MTKHRKSLLNRHQEPGLHMRLTLNGIVSHCIKIDKDVLDALKAEGKGYQTRINKILRKAVLGA